LFVPTFQQPSHSDDAPRGRRDESFALSGSLPPQVSSRSHALSDAGAPKLTFAPFDLSPFLRGKNAGKLCSRQMDKITEDPSPGAVLNYEEMMSVDSTEQLQQLYLRRGITFESPEDFLYRIRSDWLCARREMIREIDGKEGLP